MAWFTLHFHSNALRQETTVNIVLPDMTDDGHGVSLKDLPIVYLLHGYTNNQNSWLLDTNVHYLAETHGVAVVMPYGGNSFYTDTVAGGDYETYLTEELPTQLKTWFGMKKENGRTHIAGNSMGAIGAVKYALTYPGRFQSVAALSGPLDISFIELSKQIDPEAARAIIHDFSDQAEWVEGGQNDPAMWINTYKQNRLENDAPEVKIDVYCGQDDNLLPMSEAFVARCKAADVSVQFKTSAGGHNFGYWQEALSDWFKKRFPLEEDA